ncbi:MAG: type II CAAX endopeptidase family protein [Tissierellia bacterium]|nr:type II CAAX endopeptidase family protein [Tissierellia bacterium]
MKRKIISMEGGFLTFMVVALLYIFLGSIFQLANLVMGLFLSQILFLILVPWVVVKYKKYDMKLSFGVERAKRSVYWRVILIMILTYPLASMLSAFFSSLMDGIIPMPDLSIPLPKTFPEYLRSLFFFAIVPGVCEEWIFRGFLYRAMDGVKIRARIVFLAALFALFHLNPHNVVGPFILGLVIGFIRYRTGSIYPAMVAHATNNGIAMTIAYALRDMTDTVEDANLTLENMQISGIQIFFVIAITCILIFALYSMLRNFPRYNRKRTIVDAPSTRGKVMMGVAFLLVTIGFSFAVYALMYGNPL